MHLNKLEIMNTPKTNYKEQYQEMIRKTAIKKNLRISQVGKLLTNEQLLVKFKRLHRELDLIVELMKSDNHTVQCDTCKYDKFITGKQHPEHCQLQAATVFECTEFKQIES